MVLLLLSLLLLIFMVKLNFDRMMLGNFTEFSFFFSPPRLWHNKPSTCIYCEIVWMLTDFLIIILLSLMGRNGNIIAAGDLIKALEIRGGTLVSGLLEK